MILATRIVLLVFCAFFLLTAVGAKTEKRGYMNIAGGSHNCHPAFGIIQNHMKKGGLF